MNRKIIIVAIVMTLLVQLAGCKPELKQDALTGEQVSNAGAANTVTESADTEGLAETEQTEDVIVSESSRQESESTIATEPDKKEDPVLETTEQTESSIVTTPETTISETTAPEETFEETIPEDVEIGEDDPWEA